MGQRPLSITTGDFNGDTHPDIATANLNSANVSLLFGNGDGTFDPTVNILGGASPSYIVSADVNHDQHLDLIIAHGTVLGHSVVILLGVGNGTFTFAHSYSLGSVPVSLAVGEFNNDGNADLAVVDSDLSSVLILHGDGAGDFTFTRNYGVGLVPSRVLPEDVDGDGRVDLLCANFGANSISLLKNVGEARVKLPGKSDSCATGWFDPNPKSAIPIRIE